MLRSATAGIGICALVIASGAVAKGGRSPPPPPPPIVQCQPPAEPPAPAKVRVLILDLKTQRLPPTLGASLAQVVAAQGARVEGYQILAANDVRATLEVEASRQLMGCNDNSCLAELADALDATLFVHGTVERTPDAGSLVSLSLLNTRALVVVNRVTLTWRGEDAKLADVVETAAQLLMLEPKMRPNGKLRVVGLPSDATLFIDGMERPASAALALAIGPHEVRVNAPGKLPSVTAALVRSGQETAVEPVLEDEPVAGVWLVAGGLGVAAAGIGATAGVLWFLGRGSVSPSVTMPAYTLRDVEALKGQP